MAGRVGRVERATRETEVRVELALDGAGQARVFSGVGFLDHMLAAFARTALFDLEVHCRGDLEVDAHHSVEDVGIALGQALRQAVGDRAGLRRYGWALVPMDGALARVALDLSGRPYLRWDAPLALSTLGAFPTELAPEFWRAVAVHAGWTLHVDLLAQDNAHHALEAIWKAAGLAARQAVAADPRIVGVLSTKGSLE